MGAAVLPVDANWGECLVPPAAVPRAMEAEVQRVVGAVPDWLPRLAPCPWLVRTLAVLIGRPLAYAPDTLCDLISLVVSQDNSCRYCYGVQRAVLRIYGFSDREIDALLREFHVAKVSPSDRAALEFARRLTRANPRPGRREFDEVVRAGMRREAVLEVAAVAASSNFANRLSTFLALPPESLERLPATPMFRLVRPLIAWRMRHRRALPTPPPVPNDGPCAAVVAALGDSPTAPMLRRIIDDAWASDVLPRRTKALILGVVGRALGCAHAEREARAFLAAEGFGSSDELDEVFTTLRSPRLDAREARLVPFARETVRYQPAAIQERLRAVVHGFTAEEILEAVGMLALANAVCRLSVVLDAC
jgi:AhpD family alkylhydroperoxidase